MSAAIETAYTLKLLCCQMYATMTVSIDDKHVTTVINVTDKDTPNVMSLINKS